MDLLELLEDETKGLVIIYPGRFHPFHIGHGKVYQYLKRKFPNAQVFISTSDRIDNETSPFTFEEKKKMMMLAGVDSGAIRYSKSPYQSIEITEQFDKDKDVVVFAVSEKDMEEEPRFDFSKGISFKKNGEPAYLQKWNGLDASETYGTHGYIATTPTFKFKVRGEEINSASQIRNMIAKSDDTELNQILQDLYNITDIPKDIIEIFKRKIGNKETMNENWSEYSLSEFLIEIEHEEKKMKKGILQTITEGKSPHTESTDKHESIDVEFARKVKEVLETKQIEAFEPKMDWEKATGDVTKDHEYGPSSEDRPKGKRGYTSSKNARTSHLKAIKKWAKKKRRQMDKDAKDGISDMGDMGDMTSQERAKRSWAMIASKGHDEKQGLYEAVGEFAEPIYQLIDDLGGDNDAYEIVLDDLVRYMGGDTIQDFVADFRRDHDIGIGTLGQDESKQVKEGDYANEQHEQLEYIHHVLQECGDGNVDNAMVDQAIAFVEDIREQHFNADGSTKSESISETQAQADAYHNETLDKLIQKLEGVRSGELSLVAIEPVIDELKHLKGVFPNKWYNPAHKESVNEHEVSNDDTRDIAIRCVDEMIEDGLIPDETDTDNDIGFQVQDIIHDQINKSFRPGQVNEETVEVDNKGNIAGYLDTIDEYVDMLFKMVKGTDNQKTREIAYRIQNAVDDIRTRELKLLPSLIRAQYNPQKHGSIGDGPMTEAKYPTSQIQKRLELVDLYLQNITEYLEPMFKDDANKLDWEIQADIASKIQGAVNDIRGKVLDLTLESVSTREGEKEQLDEWFTAAGRLILILGGIIRSPQAKKKIGDIIKNGWQKIKPGTESTAIAVTKWSPGKTFKWLSLGYVFTGVVDIIDMITTYVGKFLDAATIKGLAEIIWKNKIPVAGVMAIIYGGKMLKDYVMDDSKDEKGDTTINNYYNDELASDMGDMTSKEREKRSWAMIASKSHDEKQGLTEGSKKIGEDADTRVALDWTYIDGTLYDDILQAFQDEHGEGYYDDWVITANKEGDVEESINESTFSVKKYKNTEDPSKVGLEITKLGGMGGTIIIKNKEELHDMLMKIRSNDENLKEWSWRRPFKFSRPDVIGSKMGNKDSYQRSPIRTIKLPVGNLQQWLKDGVNQDQSSESIEQMQEIYKYNEDRNNHSGNILMLAHAFGTRPEIKAIQGLMKVIKRQGHVTPEQNEIMYNAIHKKYIDELFPERVTKVKEGLSKLIDNQKKITEAGILHYSDAKGTPKYSEGYKAAKDGVKYDENPYSGREKLQWSRGHNDWRADELAAKGEPNYGARGQFENAK